MLPASHSRLASRQVTEAFPWDTAPRYLLRDRDASYGQDFGNQVDAMGIAEVVSAARSAGRMHTSNASSVRFAASNGMDPASFFNGPNDRAGWYI